MIRIKKVFLILIFIFFFISIVPGTTFAREGTLSFHDLNLQKHSILLFYSNGSLFGEISSNESINYNTSLDLNIQFIPTRMDAVSTGDQAQSLLWGYFPWIMFAFVMFIFAVMLVSLFWSVIVDKLGKG